ncbi:MATE family efflux transporter [Parabacteroides distasonis]|uniref:MATE family efflux transporter n=1 Tax=Parabacteroides distasonis TaxID=823 RepID=UPI001BAB289B|nr:MATE family efflux transporter [Parabacteroides distasonis]QUR49904.1 MATE family efflux transporter [Parabacteroides distasonis]
MQNVSQEKYRQLQAAPIGKLLLQYSIPAIINMAVVSLYNLTDSIFIGNGVGALAISGLAITFPIINGIIAFNTLVGIGGTTLTSISLGRKQYEKATEVLHNVVILGFIISLLTGWIIYLNLDTILWFFGASESTLPYAKEYIEILLRANPITFLFLSLNNLLRGNGFPKKSLESTLLTVGLNLILTPIFIFALNLGIKGASIATVISQVIGLIWVVRLFCLKSNKVHFQRKYFKFKFRLATEIMKLGTPPFILNLCTATITIALINRIGFYGGDFAVGAYGIVSRIYMLFSMVIIGLSIGMQPIIGFNYGAGLMDRVIKTLNMGLTIAFVFMFSVFLLSEMATNPIIRLFSDEISLNDMAIVGLRICAWTFPVMAVQTTLTNFFQSIGKPKTSIILSLIRQIGFLIPLIFLLPEMFNLGLNGIWISIPCADTIACFVTVWVYLTYRQRLKIVMGAI